MQIWVSIRQVAPPRKSAFDERLIDRRYRVAHDCRVKGSERARSRAVSQLEGHHQRGGTYTSPFGGPLEAQQTDRASGDGTRGHLELTQAHRPSQIGHIRCGQRLEDIAGQARTSVWRRAV